MRYRAALFLFVIGTSTTGQATLPIFADVTDQSDFRVRLSAVFALIKSHPPGARSALERALSDSHPVVRAAAAAGLGKLSDRGALGVLRERLREERDESVRNQVKAAISKLEHSGYLVQVGEMRIMTAAKSNELSNVMKGATRVEAEKFASVLERADSQAVARAHAQRTPVLRLDGQLRTLAQEKKDGRIAIRAKVEFSIVKVPGQTLAGTLTGAAMSLDQGDQSVVDLQASAVRGAVESALRGAEQGLRAAAE